MPGVVDVECGPDGSAGIVGPQAGDGRLDQHPPQVIDSGVLGLDVRLVQLPDGTGQQTVADKGGVLSYQE